MSYIANSLKVRTYMGKSVGNGQCVALVHAVVNVPPSSLWHRGDVVKGNTSLPIGTIIATFDADGSYGNHTNGTSHAAIYLGQNGTGIQVLDQWHGHNGSKPVHERTIYFHAGYKAKVDDGDQFYVVQ